LSGNEMTTTAIATMTNNMEGSLIALNGNQELVLFNLENIARPTPVTAATYAFAWHPATMHNLVGMVPDGAYDVTYDGNNVTLTQSASGNYMASPSGVLRFAVSLPNGIENGLLPSATIALFPNPTQGAFTLRWDNGNFESAEIRNAMGQLIAQYPLASGKGEAMLHIADTGIYFVTLRQAQHPPVTRKVIVTR
jgi:hypothetical protein